MEERKVDRGKRLDTKGNILTVKIGKRMPSILVVVSGLRKKGMAVSVKRYGVSFEHNETILHLDGTDGCVIILIF